MTSRPSTVAPILAVLAVVLVTLVARPIVAAEESFDPQAAILAALDAVEKHHLDPKPSRPPLAHRWHAEFLERLDPRRMYFLQEDVRALHPSDEYASAPEKHANFKAATAARDLLRQRVRGALELANECRTKDHDFSLDEGCPRWYDAFAKTKDELRQRWRLQGKLEVLREQAHGRTLPDPGSDEGAL